MKTQKQTDLPNRYTHRVRDPEAPGAFLRLFPAKAMLACILLFASTAAAQDTDHLRARDIRLEQRVFSSHLDTAEHDLEQAQLSFSIGTYNLAWVNVANAGDQLDQVKPKMEGHPQRIAEVPLFVNPESRRADWRDAFYALRDRFYDVNRKTIALEIDIGRQLGIDIPYLRQLRDAINRIGPHLSPEERERLEDLARRIEAAIRAGDTDRARELMKELEEKIKDAVEGNREAQDSLPSETRESLERGKSEDFDDRETDRADRDARDRDRGERYRDDRDRERDDRYRDDRTDRDRDRTDREREHDRDPARDFTGQLDLGDGIVIDFRGGRGIKAEYSGGVGALLLSETEQLLRALEPEPVVEEGDSREWDLRLQQVPGSTEQRSGLYSARLRVSDPNHLEHLKIRNWRVLDDDGQTVAEGGEGFEFDLRIDESGSYTIEARGESNWGSPVTLRRVITVAL